MIDKNNKIEKINNKMEMILNEKDNDVNYTDNYSYEQLYSKGFCIMGRKYKRKKRKRTYVWLYQKRLYSLWKYKINGFNNMNKTYNLKYMENLNRKG